MAWPPGLDVIGPLTRTVNDTALVLDVIAGRDDLDSTTIERDARSYTDLSFELKGAKIGILREYMDDNLAPDIKAYA